MNRRGEKRIRRELAAIEDARAKAEPHASGLAIAFNQGDSCPRFYVLRGSQRFSQYSGYVIHFRIQFPSDYPFEPFMLLVTLSSHALPERSYALLSFTVSIDGVIAHSSQQCLFPVL